MPEFVSFTLVTLSAVFFVVDPFAVIPLFLTLTSGNTVDRQRAVAARAAIVATLTLLLFAAAGGVIFKLFGITLGAFKIAGGLLLFLMAVDMLRAQKSRTRTSPEEESEGVGREDVAIIPLAIPMLAGPGAIATVMVLMSEARRSLAHVAVVVACVLLTGVISWLMLRAAPLLEKLLRQSGLNIITRVMGLMLAAIAVQFVVNGIRDVLPQIRGDT